MTHDLENDWLLKTFKTLLGALVIFLGAITAVFVFIAAAMPFIGTELAPEMLVPGKTAITGADVATMTGLFACLAVLIGLVTYFLHLLRRIVASVGEGDPFVSENADRLVRMAWALTGAWVMGLGVTLFEFWADRAYSDGKTTADIAFDGFDIGSILLVLVLFILARVFRHGAAMRDDLEGTV